MDLISKRDALDKVHKTIESLILRLPTVRGVDGEDYCTDHASLAAYNMAYEHIRREIQGIPSWHTEDPNVVEVVRCKDCKYGDTGTDEIGSQFYKCIGIHYGGVSPTDYCSYGERKDG